MPRPTSSCMNCGGAKSQGEYLADYCGDCFAAIAGAQADPANAGRDQYEVKRAALAARAHHAHRNFVDPRSIDRHTQWVFGNRPDLTPPPPGMGQ